MEQSRRGVQAKQCAVGNGGRGGFWLALLRFVVPVPQCDRGVGPTREARGGALSAAAAEGSEQQTPKARGGKEIGARLV